MKQIRLYNVIFPVWLLLFFPPVIFITLFGNFIIDSIMLILCFLIFKLKNLSDLKSFYIKNILKVWIFGFVADILGALLLFAAGMFGRELGIPYEVSNAINFNPYKNIAATLIVITAMLISALFIFIFNYYFTFPDTIENKKLRLKAAITIAIVTMPWTFMIPTTWLYKGF